MKNKALAALSKAELIELIELNAKNWLAMDGLWFQSVEEKYGIEEALIHDEKAMRRFTVIEAGRIKQFLGLPERSGIEGLKKALSLRMYASINEGELIEKGNMLIYRVLDCRVQNSRQRKGLPFHPCKSVGLIEYSYFAQVIDERFVCQALSCYPEITDDSCSCSWQFTLTDQ